jgi:hypothetical protein
MRDYNTPKLTYKMLMFSSLCCCLATAAAAAGCPRPEVAILQGSSTPKNVTLITGKSYKLGPGVFVLSKTVEVDVNSVLW